MPPHIVYVTLFIHFMDEQRKEEELQVPYKTTLGDAVKPHREDNNIGLFNRFGHELPDCVPIRGEFHVWLKKKNI